MTAVPARVPLRRLRGKARRGAAAGRRLTDIYAWVFVAAVAGLLAAGAARPLIRALAGAGHAVPGPSARLFVVAAVLLLLGALAQLLRAAGPVTASSAFRFWLLAAPVSRRGLLLRRYAALLCAVVVLAAAVVVPVAHAVSVPALPVVAVMALAAVGVAGGAVWAQASEIADRAAHAAGQAARWLGVAAFGSLATGAGRSGAGSALRAPSPLGALLLAALAAAALACVWCGYRALDRIDVSVLRRGQGLWTAGHVAAVSMDAFMLAEFFSDQRARSAGRARPVRLGANLALALLRSEGARLRRRPGLAARFAAAAVVWWGCRAVLPPPFLAALATVMGYALVLPAAGALRQLMSNPGLRSQFAPRDRWLARASVIASLAVAAAWAAVVAPGLGGGAAMTLIVGLGLTAAVCRTVTRPPLDYSMPPVATPLGDLPLDLWRQVFRGPILLAVIAAVSVALAR